MILSLIIILATLLIDLATDLRQWTHIRHKRGLWLRLPSFIAATIIYWPSAGLWLTYGAVFDSVIGLVKYNNWLALGTTSWLDRLQRRCMWLVVVKYGVGMTGLILYIWL